MPTPSESKAHLYDVLKDFDTAMLVTRSPEGRMHARPMAVAELEPDAEAYFVTAIDSPKVAEIEADPNVTLTFQDGKRFAALSGTVSVMHDRALLDRLWKGAWTVWFPQGKDDPSVSLLRFDAEHGELWDRAGLRGVKYALRAAKARAKGETPKTGEEEHTRVDY